jgi:hypothetical protein
LPVLGVIPDLFKEGKWCELTGKAEIEILFFIN